MMKIIFMLVGRVSVPYLKRNDTIYIYVAMLIKIRSPNTNLHQVKSKVNVESYLELESTPSMFEVVDRRLAYPVSEERKPPGHTYAL